LCKQNWLHCGISGPLAPNAMVQYDKTQFPARYRDGVFIAFHARGSAPYPQSGYNVVFQPLAGDGASGRAKYLRMVCGTVKSPAKPNIVQVLAVRPDGSLYVSDDIRDGYTDCVSRRPRESGAKITRALADRSAGSPVDVAAQPPRHASRRRAAANNLPVPKGATRVMVALAIAFFTAGGGRHARAAMVTMERHAFGARTSGKGKKWLWSDGSYSGIAKTIREGVPQPKEYRSPMRRWAGTAYA